jgi:hypothetical protein
MLNLTYDYVSCVKSSEKAAWKLDDVMPEGTRLDFDKSFLPARLSKTAHLGFLNEGERRTLNQITGNSYLNLFGFVEEYILHMAVRHAQAEMFGDHDVLRALVRFADEELKHQALFKRYRVAFDRDFGHQCEVLENAADVAGVILAKSPMAVVLLTLHLEIMTQDHYVGSVRDDGTLDPFFSKLLRFHWMEESQHARIDALELDRLVEDSTPEIRERCLKDYLDIGGAFDGLLKVQSEMDARSLAKALGRTFSADEVAELVKSQHASYRYTFLVSGMTHPTFMTSVKAIFGEEGAKTVTDVATALS